MSKNNENKLVPKLRFPELTEGWDKDLLGSIAKDITTGKLDANAMTEDGQYRFYTCAKNYYKIDKYAFDKEALLIAGNGAYLGYIHHYKGKFNAYQRTYVLSEFTNNVIYLKYFLERFLPTRIKREKKDGNTPYIVLGTLTEMEIFFPKSPNEQQKIATCLSSLDDAITAEKQKLEVLKEHKKGLLQNLFPREGETVPKYRFKEFSKSWEKVKLKNLSLYFNGGSYENEVKEKGKYELITLKSINTNGQLVSSNRFIDTEVPTLAKDTLVMILSEQAPGLLGMTAIIPTANKYVLNQRVAEIRPSQEVDSYFLSMAINRNQAYFSKQGAGMKVQNISKPNVQNYEFLIPEIQEQQKIASTLSSVDDLINSQTQKIESLQVHKKGLLQGLFPKTIHI